MKPALLQADTLSDRRDLWSLLHRLHPFRRLRFLDWACAKASKPNCRCPAPVPEMSDYVRDAMRCSRADDRLTNMIYTDLVAISAQYDLDLGRAILTLEEYVRKGELPPATRIGAAGMQYSSGNTPSCHSGTWVGV